MSKRMPMNFAINRVYNKNYAENPSVIHWEVLSIKVHQKVVVRFISENSTNRQGIRMAIDAGEGNLSINGITGRTFVLWADECPREFEVDCYSEDGLLSLYNVFERKEGVKGEMRSLTAYGGMILEQSSNVFKYRCNDTGKVTEFNKLVFEIELH